MAILFLALAIVAAIATGVVLVLLRQYLATMPHRAATVPDSSQPSKHRFKPWGNRGGPSSNRIGTVRNGAVIVLICAVIIGFGIYSTAPSNAVQTVGDVLNVHEQPIGQSPAAIKAEVTEAAYVASSIKPVYHKPACRYVRLLKVKYLVTYRDEQAARTAGLAPCKVCLNHTVPKAE